MTLMIFCLWLGTFILKTVHAQSNTDVQIQYLSGTEEWLTHWPDVLQHLAGWWMSLFQLDGIGISDSEALRLSRNLQKEKTHQRASPQAQMHLIWVQRLFNRGVGSCLTPLVSSLGAVLLVSTLSLSCSHLNNSFQSSSPNFLLVQFSSNLLVSPYPFFMDSWSFQISACDRAGARPSLLSACLHWRSSYLCVFIKPLSGCADREESASLILVTWLKMCVS